MTDTDPPEPPRRLPSMAALTIAISLLSTTVSGVWFASNTFAQITDHERRLSTLETGAHDIAISRDQRWDVVKASLSALREEISALHAVVDALRQSMERIQGIQDRSSYRNPRQ